MGFSLASLTMSSAVNQAGPACRRDAAVFSMVKRQDADDFPRISLLGLIKRVRE